jgi:hypothetical protein
LKLYFLSWLFLPPLLSKTPLPFFSLGLFPFVGFALIGPKKGINVNPHKRQKPFDAGARPGEHGVHLHE